MNLAELRGSAARWISKLLMPILSKCRIKPNTLTGLGLAINIIAAAVIATNHLLASGLLVLLAGLFDILDGALARSTKQSTRFGALLDSTFDRLSEAVLLLGILALYLESGNTIEITVIFLALIASFLTSYVRARAEGLGLECHVGLFTRTERVIILALGLLFNQILIALLILVVLALVTVGQRLVYSRQETAKK